MLIPIPFFGWFEDEEEEDKPVEKEQNDEQN
jgi:hypothetical protein